MDRSTVWIIARVGNTYRCLAIADTWVCGRQALETCLRLTNIFSDPSNRVPLKAELRLAADWFRDHEIRDPPEELWPHPQGGSMRSCTWRNRSDHWPTGIDEPVRFPFTSTCLVLGASTPHLDLAKLRIRDERDPKQPWRNLDGLTHIFVDITDLDYVRYCFMVSQAHEQDATALVGNQPWSGRQYLETFLRCFMPEDDDVDTTPDPKSAQELAKARALAEELEKLPLVDIGALADVWPWLGVGPETASLTPRPGYAESNPRGPASLWDQAMASMLQITLSSVDMDEGLLDTLMQIPKFKGSLKRHLIAVETDLLEAPTTATLLRVAYADAAFLDWTPFRAMDPAILAAALQGSELQGARGLSICVDWGNTVASELAQAILSLPKLHDLYLMELPSRAGDGPIGEFYATLMSHPRRPRGKVLLCGACSCVLRLQRWLPDDSPAYQPPVHYPILQLAMVFDKDGGHPNHASQRPPGVDCCFLGDGFVNPVRVVNGLIDFVAQALGCEYEEGFSCSTMAALFARASPTIIDDSALEISAPPAECFSLAAWDYLRGSRLRDLAATWTVVLYIGLREKDQGLHENRQLAQCAFVRPRHGTIRVDPTNPAVFQPQDLDVFGLEEFARVAIPDFDIQTAVILDSRLQWLEQLGKSSPNPDLSFSRAALESKTVCDCLNWANEDLKRKERTPWSLPGEEIR
ncbi:hypothetical protein N658DRAFT_77236 [Parathielavia hyrcaniae]|uniref:Uncharacterized protein n=1 Tax=Parathielavia hyrcaniae TaxID=113614 RepID=A0AAN6T1P6_9PEZI|nr:hypothetical protein N658DRAFT_77236 [Parathielavia hyrcaniae]